MLNGLFKFLPRLPYREDNLFAILYLMLFIGPLFFLPIVTDAFGSPRFAMFILLMGLSLLVFAFRKNYAQRLNRWLVISLVGLLGLSVISTAFSIDLINSLAGNYRQANSLLFLILWGGLILLLALVNSKDKIAAMMRVLVMGGFLVAVVGVLHYFGLGIYVSDTVNTRPITPGLIGNQNFSALYVIGIMPLIIPLFKRATNFYSKIYYLVSGFAMITSLAIFASRGAILGLGIGLAVAAVLVLVRRNSWVIKGIVAGSLVLLVLMGGLFYTSTRMMDAKDSLTLSDASGQNRLTAWLRATDIIGDSPWHGVGFGNFIYGYKSMVTDATNSGGQFDDAHNIYLQLGATAGVPAALLFCIVLLIAAYSSYSVYRKSLSEDSALVSLAILIALICVAVGMSFTPVDTSNWILLAFLLAASQFAEPDKTLKGMTKFLANKYFKSGTVIVAAVLVVVGVMYMISLMYYQEGYNNYILRDYEKSERSLRIADRLDPLSSAAKPYIMSIMIKRQADPEIVRTEINKYIYLHPGDADIRYTGSYLYYMLYEYSHDPSDLTRSLAHIDIYTELQPNSAPALLRQAYLYYKTGLTDRAEVILQQSATLVNSKQNYYGYLLLAQIQLENGQLEAMSHSLEKAYQLQNSMALKLLIESYKAGEFDLKTLPIGFPPVDIT